MCGEYVKSQKKSQPAGQEQSSKQWTRSECVAIASLGILMWATLFVLTVLGGVAL